MLIPGMGWYVTRVNQVQICKCFYFSKLDAKSHDSVVFQTHFFPILNI